MERMNPSPWGARQEGAQCFRVRGGHHGGGDALFPPPPGGPHGPLPPTQQPRLTKTVFLQIS